MQIAIAFFIGFLCGGATLIFQGVRPQGFRGSDGHRYRLVKCES